MYIHLETFEVIEFLPDDSFVAGCEARPGLVCPAVILLSLRHLDVVVETDDLWQQGIRLRTRTRERTYILARWEGFTH